MRNHKDKSEIGSGQVSDCDALDRALYAALANYAAIAPRTGIEERILANLRAERERPEIRSWWRWPATVAFAALAVVLVVSMVWRSARPVYDVAVHRPHATTSNIPELQIDATNRGTGNPTLAHQAERLRRNNPRVSHPATVASSSPKLDRFPSPRPLNEQEKILQTYFSNYSKDGILVARAWAAAQHRDAEEEMRDDAGMSEKDLQQ
jgi:hypothetical protein